MQILFGKRKVRSSTNFAEEVLELETQLDTDCSLSKVKRLMELYSQAIEFYSPRQDPRYLHYQERLQTLLSRKDVLSLLDIAEPVSANARSSTPKPKKTDLNSERIAEKTLQSHVQCVNKTSRQAQAEIQGQQHLLDSRLTKRKNQKTGVKETFDLDDIKDSFEHEIEAIMEKFVTGKLEEKNRLEEKYNTEREEILDIGNQDLTQKILERMNQSFKQELADSYQKLEDEKNARLQQLRKSFSAR